MVSIIKHPHSRRKLKMLRSDVLMSKVSTKHQAKLAYVYVRQSSLGQVTRHGESTDLQYH